MKNPTSLKIRSIDDYGSGKYLASRGNRLHRGLDFVCIPGQPIVAPISGFIPRISRPYANDIYSGLVIQNEKLTIKLWYFEPYSFVVSHRILSGEEIGLAQDISIRYPGITPHVHLEIDHLNPEILINL